jgi:hypothetical protein
LFFLDINECKTPVILVFKDPKEEPQEMRFLRDDLGRIRYALGDRVLSMLSWNASSSSSPPRVCYSRPKILRARLRLKIAMTGAQ